MSLGVVVEVFMDVAAIGAVVGLVLGLVAAAYGAAAAESNLLNSTIWFGAAWPVLLGMSFMISAVAGQGHPFSWDAWWSSAPLWELPWDGWQFWIGSGLAVGTAVMWFAASTAREFGDDRNYRRRTPPTTAARVSVALSVLAFATSGVVAIVGSYTVVRLTHGVLGSFWAAAAARNVDDALHLLAVGITLLGFLLMLGAGGVYLSSNGRGNFFSKSLFVTGAVIALAGFLFDVLIPVRQVLPVIAFVVIALLLGGGAKTASTGRAR